MPGPIYTGQFTRPVGKGNLEMVPPGNIAPPEIPETKIPPPPPPNNRVWLRTTGSSLEILPELFSVFDVRGRHQTVYYGGRKVQSLPRSTFLRYDWYFSATIWYFSATIDISLLRLIFLCYDWHFSATIDISLLRLAFLCYDWYFSATIDISLLRSDFCSRPGFTSYGGVAT